MLSRFFHCANISRVGKSVLFMTMFGMMTLPAIADNPAAKYLPKIKVDEFNPDVTDEYRADPKPKRGGKLILRTPADLQHLNILTLTGQPERIVCNHMSDGLIKQDPETLEYYPVMALTWRETDLLKKKDGEVMEGRVVAQTGESVTFVKDAWIHYYSKLDVDEINKEGNYVSWKDSPLGANRTEGKITELDYVVKVDQGLNSSTASSNTVTIPLSEIDTYDFEMGSYKETRPYIKMNCAYEFMIRDGVTWSDGKPFTAEDVKFSFDTIMNIDVDAPSKRAYFIDVESCEITRNSKAIKFHIKKPYFQARDILGGAAGEAYFIPKHIFKPEQYGGDSKAFAEAFNDSDFKERPIYTGPYVLKSWNRGDTLTLARNENYWLNKLPDGSVYKWNKQMPYLDEISIVLYREQAGAISDLLNGKLDGDLDVEPIVWASDRTNTADFLQKSIRAEKIGFLYTYIGWNLNREIFKDKRVREALAMLIPREEIANNVHMGVAFPVNGPFFVNGPGYDKSIEPIPYDPVGAKRLLARAGWLDRDGDGIIEKRMPDGSTIPFEFSYSIHNARDYHQKIADIIKESVEQAGISMTVDKSDWTIFADKVREKNFDAVRFAWGTTLEPDPFQIWHSSQMENKGDNFVSFKNDRLDELCIKIRETLDPEKRWEMGREAHRIIYENQPYSFLFGFKETYFLNRKLRGIKLYPNMYTFDYCEWYWSEIPESRK